MDPRPPDHIPGFTSEGFLAHGRHGAVWRARRADGTAAALKVIPASRLGDTARFEREAAVLEGIDHPHIIRCLGHGRSGDDLWLAMELAEGDAAALMRSGPAATADILAIGRDIAAGLDALAGRGLVHRDLSPANILHLLDGRWVIGDFGLVQVDHERQTVGGVMGTPAYLAPEQASGATVGPAADTYALGAVLFALATGRVPYAGDSVWEVLAQVSTGRFPDLRDARPDAPLELRAIIRAATARLPEDRYGSAQELGADCTSVLAGGVPRNAGAVRARAGAVASTAVAPAPGRVWPLVAGLAVAGLILGLIAGRVLGGPDRAERAAFATAVASGSPEAWQRYLAAHPQGAGAAAATHALESLASAPAPPDPEARKQLERRLAELESRTP